MTLGSDRKTLAPQERLDEVAAILATGLLRVRRRQGTERPFSTDSSAGNCLEVPPETRLTATVDARKGDIACN